MALPKLKYDDCLSLARVFRYPSSTRQVLEFNHAGKVVGFTQSFAPDANVPSPVFNRWCTALRPWASSYGFDLETDVPTLDQSFWVSPHASRRDTLDRRSDRYLSASERQRLVGEVEKLSGLKFTLDLDPHNVVYFGVMHRRPPELRAIVTFEHFEFDLPEELRQTPLLLGSFGTTKSVYGQWWDGSFPTDFREFLTARSYWTPECQAKLDYYLSCGGFLFWKLSPGPAFKFYAMFHS